MNLESKRNLICLNPYSDGCVGESRNLNAFVDQYSVLILILMDV